MEVVNADYGIDTVPAKEKARTWYRWHRFPLLPIFWYRTGDDWNTSDFSFSWLNLRIHSGMAPQIGISVSVDDMGAVLGIELPYLYIRLWLLLFPQRWHQRLWRVVRKARV